MGGGRSARTRSIFFILFSVLFVFFLIFIFIIVFFFIFVKIDVFFFLYSIFNASCTTRPSFATPAP